MGCPKAIRSRVYSTVVSKICWQAPTLKAHRTGSAGSSAASIVSQPEPGAPSSAACGRRTFSNRTSATVASRPPCGRTDTPGRSRSTSARLTPSGRRAVLDELLAPIQDEAVAAGRQLGLDHLRTETHARVGHGQGGHELALAHGRQELALLVGRAAVQYQQRRQYAGGEDRRRQRAAAEALKGDRGIHGAAAGAAELLRDLHAQPAGLGGGAEQAGVVAVLALVGAGHAVRLDLALHEIGDALLEHLLLVGEAEVHLDRHRGFLFNGPAEAHAAGDDQPIGIERPAAVELARAGPQQVLEILHLVDVAVRDHGVVAQDLLGALRSRTVRW